MFHDIPESIKIQMEYLEELDRQDRIDGTPRMERLSQIPPETGKFVSLLAASAPKGIFLEIGTSAGYSTLWIALACRLNSNKLITFEILKEKVKLARETFELTKLQDIIELIEGDARDYIHNYKKPLKLCNPEILDGSLFGCLEKDHIEDEKLFKTLEEWALLERNRRITF